MTLDKGAKTISGDKVVFSVSGLGQLDAHMGKIHLGHRPYTLNKWIISLKVKCKTIKLLGGYILRRQDDLCLAVTFRYNTKDMS